MEPRLVSIDERQSTLIKAIRFPLIVMVLFIHSPGVFSSPTVEWSADGWNIYHFVAEMFSMHICAISTRWFFLLSGYLFFRYMKEGVFSFKWVTEKWKKRLNSLVIPFLIWNAIAVLAIVLKNSLFEALSLGKSAEEWELVKRGPLFWFFTGPADFPLWFLRDLIAVSVLAPIFYLVFKRVKWISLIVLFAAYYSLWNPSFPSMQALFFFGIGVWLGTHKIDLLPLCKNVRIPALIATIILLPLATSQIGRPLHLLWFRLFIPVGMITFLNLFDSIIDNEPFCKRLCALSTSVFFIYAAHEIYILGWTKGLFLRIFGDSLAGTWVRYWLVPLFVLAVCLILYRILHKIMPRTLAFICGGRTKV